MESFSGKHVLVLGLGLHGGAVGNITWLASEGARVTVSDTKSEKELTKTIQQLSHIPDITYLFGNQDDLDLSNIDYIIRNPAVPRHSAIIETARSKNIPILMDSSIFFSQIDRNRIIGITGSKGKTTTSHAIYHVLKTIFPNTIIVGTDGMSPLKSLLPLTKGELEGLRTTQLTSPSPFFVRRGNEPPIIFELSSWRLEALQEFHLSPHIAVCTSIYKDHLNTYSSYEEYIDVKKQIIKDQHKDDVALLNYDDEIIRTWEKDVRGKLFWYSVQGLPRETQGAKWGIWVDKEDVIIRMNSPEEIICSISDIPYSSPHELRNKLPAIFIALLYGATTDQIINAVRNIPPLQHRMQLVRELDGVQYINDTTATMPDATIAELQYLDQKPLILILGGSDKALEFADLVQAIGRANIKHIIWLPGTVTQRMQEEIVPHTKTISHDVNTMNEAVSLAHQLARPGDTVLLSPGATSFGLFVHEFARGDAFITAVQNLKK
ncbi:MAG TPA: UDP-N-acetylmuramoyl-L-alanine--D-glutamate ligase [Candidatus Andersenbacteria bacterium]|nr:UDP-N-acetylmuramoyl-L-alanine--D-glutamate ligase [Candidatus Andersenbacteria bacterium]